MSEAKQPRKRATNASRSTRAASRSGQSATRSRGRSTSRSNAGGKTLVIVESGAKADTIGRFLGDDYVVSACFGHIRDLPRRASERPAELQRHKDREAKEFAVDVNNPEEPFKPFYIVPSESKKHITRLRQELKEADHVLLATDEDREGESIGWHLVEVLKPKVPYERIVFHEITAEALTQALREPRGLDQNLIEAQESRRILDRLYGYSLSPVLWRKVGQGASAGRVQSVALRFLVERERERMAFVAAEYWDAEATMRVEGGAVRARLTSLGGQQLAASTADFDPATGLLSETEKRHETEASLAALRPALEAAEWRVAEVTRRSASLGPRPPYTTSTLQQDASNRLGFAARRTMAAAQALYQGKDLGPERVGLITYMRTDSVTLSDQALNQAGAYVRNRFGEEYAERRVFRTRSRNAQEAHEAIRPTDLSRTPESLRGMLDDDEYRLYELIWRRTVASQMAAARVERTSVAFEGRLPDRPDDDPALFSASGQVVLFDGWYKVLPPRSDGADAVLPPLSEGEPAQLESLEPNGHETQPPARYTEASLVRKLEEDGLGRPSTYAAVISTLTQREYVSRKGQTLIPTFLGFAVTDLLTQHFADLVNAEFTAEMEDQLDQIAKGETDSQSHLSEFYFGSDGEAGLRSRVAEKIDTIPFWALELSEGGLRLVDSGDAGAEDPERIEVRVRGGSAFLRRGVGEDSRTAPLPPDMAPGDLTLPQANELLGKAMQLPRQLGRHPDYDDDVWLMNGRFGPFVQVGETSRKKGAPKPRRASVPKDMELADVTIEDAIEWLRFPKSLGAHPESGEDVTVRPGRWGPYVQCGAERRNLKAEDDLETIELERALELLAEPKRPRGAPRRSPTNRRAPRRS